MSVTTVPVDDAPSLDDWIDRLVDEGRIVHVRRLPPRPARTAELASPLPESVAGLVPASGLWAHQAHAIDHARAGRSVVVATGTASGKSLCYQIPIAEAASDPFRQGTALCIYPTKALAHDQLRSFTELGVEAVTAATYDGDATREQRQWVRGHANVVLTNPEMLHTGILPNHRRWDVLLRRLRYVVVDELHVLKGVFGTHTAHVLRRLRRLCALYGADPTFVFCSATVGQPGRLAAELCGLDVAEVLDDASPAGPRTFALVDPPVVDEASGSRVSTSSETAAVLSQLVADGRRCIAFCRSRKMTEVVAADVARRLPAAAADTVRPYRAGYLAEERRSVEDDLAAGRLRGVVTTSALELGVDIGGLDACVISGFPGTIASLWQQAGRVGRGGAESLVVLVAGDDQLDRWFVRHPDELFDRPPEPAVVNLANPFVLEPHLACAAFEKPLAHADDGYWPDLLDDGVRSLVLDDRLRCKPGGLGPVAVWDGAGVPAPRVGLRTGMAGEFRIVDGSGRLVGTVDAGRAVDLVHPGAVYLHQGRAYRVVDLDVDGHRAVVTDHDGDEYTQTRSETGLDVLGIDQERRLGSTRLALGEVEVTSRVIGYQRKDRHTREILESVELDLPPGRLITRAVWYVIDPDVVAAAGLDDRQVPSALHAAEHAAIGVLPLFTICDRWDVGGVSIAHHPATGGPTIFVYDGYPGGAGIAELGFDAADRHLAAALDVIAACPCESGCPSCVQSPKCGNANEWLDKAAAHDLLRALLADRRSRPRPPGHDHHDHERPEP